MWAVIRTCLLPAYGLAAALMLLLTLVACNGDNGGGGGGDSHVDTYWVSIRETYPPTSPDQRTVQESAIQLYGSAECDNCPPDEVSCPADHPPQPSTINVTWTNRTTGETGIPFFNGIVGSCICIPFFPCFVSYSHEWYTRPFEMGLAYGENLIAVTASGPSKAPGTDSIRVTRVPGTVGNLTAAPGKQQVTLIWDPVPDAASYNIYWSTTRSVSNATGTLIAGVTSPYTQTGLVDGQTYYYIVTSVRDAGESLPSSIVAATPGWMAESVATTTGRTITSIATDSAGKAHIHYANSASTGTGWSFQSYYVTNVTGTWSSLLVDQSSSPSYLEANADIALDSLNTVHVSFVNSSGLTHAIYASGAWLREVVDASASCNASLALDAANKAHIAYFTPTSLRYATNRSGAWTNVVIDEFQSPVNCGERSRGSLSLGMDAAGAAHIAYERHYLDGSIRYRTNRGGSWTVSWSQAYRGGGLSLAVDPTRGTVHIVNTSNFPVGLAYAHNVSETWTVEAIEECCGFFPSLSLDTAGSAHVSYDFPGDELRYASNSSGTWHSTTIQSVASIGNTDIALDSQGNAHISYLSQEGIRYATNK